MVVHIQPSDKLWDAVQMLYEVKCDWMDKALKNDDKVFFIRACTKRTEQEEVMRKVKACLDPEPIRYKYHGYYGSCQTFCTTILGLETLMDMNPEACLVSTQSIFRRCFSYFFNDKKVFELSDKMDDRFTDGSNVTLGSDDDDSLVDMCPPGIIQPPEK